MFTGFFFFPFRLKTNLRIFFRAEDLTGVPSKCHVHSYSCGRCARLNSQNKTSSNIEHLARTQHQPVF